MDRLHVAIVCPAEDLRLQVAKAFDAAPADWELSLHREPPAEAADVIVSAGVELEGAVPFHAETPERLIPDVQARLAQSSRSVVAVVGSSGGCGATSLALHLAAAGSRKTCLVDLNEDAAVALRLGLDPAVATPSSDDARPIPVTGGFRLLSLPATTRSDQLERVIADFERVVIEVSPERLPEVRQRCHAGVLVMLPTVPSAKRAALVLEAHADLPWAVVSNRVGPGGETTRAELQRAIGRRISLELPCSPALRDTEGEGQLLGSAFSSWRMKVLRLAETLEQR